jgi:hypothetical protein
MERVPTPHYSKPAMQSTVRLPVSRDTETTYPFQWLLFKPQLHAVEPFKAREQTRLQNVNRSQ